METTLFRYRFQIETPDAQVWTFAIYVDTMQLILF